MQTFKWTGTFWSNSYSLFGFYTPVKGEIEVELAGIDCSGYDAPFKLTYVGVYRSGQIINGIVYVTNDKMTAKLSDTQTVTFTTTERTANKIKGKYTSDNPSDGGEFELHRL